MNVLAKNEFDASKASKYEVRVFLCGYCDFLQLDHEIPEKEFYTQYQTPSSWKTDTLIDPLISEIREIFSGNNNIKFLR